MQVLSGDYCWIGGIYTKPEIRNSMV